MAETVYFNDGSCEVCCCSEIYERVDFFERLLREKLGDDSANFFDALFVEYQEELDRNGVESKEIVDDGYLAMCHDACGDFKAILAALSMPRLNRNKLRDLAQRGYDRIYNNL